MNSHDPYDELKNAITNVYQELDSKLVTLSGDVQRNHDDVTALNNHFNDQYRKMNCHLSWLNTKLYEQTRQKLVNFSYDAIKTKIDNKKHNVIATINDVLNGLDDNETNFGMYAHTMMVDSLKEYSDYGKSLIESEFNDIARFIKNNLDHDWQDYDNACHHAIFNDDVAQFLMDFYSLRLFQILYEDMFEIILTVYGLHSWNVNKTFYSIDFIGSIIENYDITTNKQLAREILANGDIYEEFMTWFRMLDIFDKEIDSIGIKDDFSKLFVFYMDKLIYACSELLNITSIPQIQSSFTNIQATFDPFQLSFVLSFSNGFFNIDKNVFDFSMTELIDIENKTQHEFIFNVKLFDSYFEYSLFNTERYQPSLLNNFNEYVHNDCYHETSIYPEHVYDGCDFKRSSTNKFKSSTCIAKTILLFKYIGQNDKETIYDIVQKLMEFYDHREEGQTLTDSLKKPPKDRFNDLVHEKYFCDIIKQTVVSQYVMFNNILMSDSNNTINITVWSKLPNSLKKYNSPHSVIPTLLDEDVLTCMYKLSMENPEDSIQRIAKMYDLDDIREQTVKDVDKHLTLARGEFQYGKQKYNITLTTYFKKFLFITEDDLIDPNTGGEIYSPDYKFKNNVVKYLNKMYRKIDNFNKLLQ